MFWLKVIVGNILRVGFREKKRREKYRMRKREKKHRNRYSMRRRKNKKEEKESKLCSQIFLSVE